jgi:hypothetical protein
VEAIKEPTSLMLANFKDFKFDSEAVFNAAFGFRFWWCRRGDPLGMYLSWSNRNTHVAASGLNLRYYFLQSSCFFRCLWKIRMLWACHMWNILFTSIGKYKPNRPKQIWGSGL